MKYNGRAEDPCVITHRHPSGIRSRLRLIINATRNVRQTSPPFRWKIPRGANGTFYIANIARLWDSLLRSRKEKENVFCRGLPAPADADELLWTERHVDEGRKQVTMPGNGRSTGWNFTPTKFNFFASSCPRKRDRTSRKDWISSLNVRNGEEGGGDGRRSLRIGPSEGLCERRVKE